MMSMEKCESKVFNSSSFQSKSKFQKTLKPGVGCYISMERTFNGSWGQVRINVPFKEEAKNLLVFDPNIQPGSQFSLSSNF